MRRYETFIIIDPDLSDDGRKPIIERIKELITQQNGTLVLLDEWGSRKLAYEIKTKTRGYYIRFDYCGLGPLVDEIERFCRIEDGVLKYMTVVLDKEVDADALQKEIAEIQSKAEAAAHEAAQEKTTASESLIKEESVLENEAEETEFSNTDEELNNE
jgi:small subunit ribosomal protein S6